jgi:hypothetical protein
MEHTFPIFENSESCTVQKQTTHLDPFTKGSEQSRIQVHVCSCTTLCSTSSMWEGRGHWGTLFPHQFLKLKKLYSSGTDLMCIDANIRGRP